MRILNFLIWKNRSTNGNHIWKFSFFFFFKHLIILLFGLAKLRREALRFTISCNPSGVRCSFLLTNSKALLKRRKSACFWVIRGYGYKGSIITAKPSIDLTRYWIMHFPWFVILPTPSDNWIRSNNALSFWSKPILKTSSTPQPVEYPLFFANSNI